MKKSFILALVCLALAPAAFGQTKKIAHKSHSGSRGSFTTQGADNFGLPPGYREYENKRKLIKEQEKDTNVKKADTLKTTRPKQPASSPKTFKAGTAAQRANRTEVAQARKK